MPTPPRADRLRGGILSMQSISVKISPQGREEHKFYEG